MSILDEFKSLFSFVQVDITDLIDLALRVFAGWYGNFTEIFDVLNGTVGNMASVVLSKVGVIDPVLGLVKTAINALFGDFAVLDLLGVSAFVTIVTIAFITLITFLLDTLNFIT